MEVPAPENSSLEKTIICQLQGIGVSFSSGSEPTEVLRDINLEMNLGDFVCVLGASGCGKTTLLRLVAGFERPEAGEIVLAGHSVCGAHQWLPPERRQARR